MRLIKLILVFNLLFAVIDLSGKNKQCLIWINTSDCSYCYVNLMHFEEIDKSLDAKIIMKKNEKKNFKTLSEKIFNNKIDKKNIMFSDDLYNRFSSVVSMVYIIDEAGKTLVSIPLKELNLNIELINSFRVINIRKRILKLPEKINMPGISQYASLYKNNFIIGNETSAKLYSLPIDSPQNSRVLFSADTVKLLDIYALNKKDTQGYHKFSVLVDSIKKQTALGNTISSVYYTEDTIYSIIQCMIPKKVKGDVVTLGYTYVFAKFYKTGKRLYKLSDHLPNDSGVFYSSFSDMGKSGNNIFLHFNDFKSLSTSYFLYQFSIGENKIKFVSPVKIVQTPYFEKNNLGRNMNTLKINGSKAAFLYKGIIYDYLNNYIDTIPLFEKNDFKPKIGITQKYVLMAMHSNLNIYSFLIYEKPYSYLVSYYKSDNKFILNQKIELKGLLDDIGSVYYLNDHQIIYTKTDNTMIVIDY